MNTIKWKAVKALPFNTVTTIGGVRAIRIPADKIHCEVVAVESAEETLYRHVHSRYSRGISPVHHTDSGYFRDLASQNTVK